MPSRVVVQHHGLAWTGGGILSTVSHEFVLLLTAPTVRDCAEHPRKVQPIEPEPAPPGMPKVVPALDPGAPPPPQL